MDERLVLALEDVGREDIALAGGKGANLGELVHMGLAVPPGFVITTTAYERHVAENGLGTLIAAGQSADADGGAAIRAALAAGDIPQEVQASILAAYEQMGAGAVAVRSSATAEDLPQAAFAGQQETYLNITGGAALLEATRRCWASLWTERAMAYRQRQGIGEEAVALAVVVQRMVAAQVAGVMFTANPLSGARDETLIDASAGLGEALVSGAVTPDHYVLKRRRGQWRVVQQRAGQREALVRALPGGGTEQVSGDVVETWPELPAGVLSQLAALGAQIAGHYGTPQDIEWAWDGSRLYILQARPITALPAASLRVSKPVQLISGILAEMMPGYPYPLEATTWGPDLMWSSFIVPFMRLLGLRVLPAKTLLEEEDGMIVRFNARTPVRPTPAVLLAPWRLLRRARRYDPGKWRADPLLARALEWTQELNERDVRALSWSELVTMVREALVVPTLIFELRFRYLPRGMLATVALRLLLALNRRGHLFGTLLTTGVETRTIDANRALEALATTIRSEPVVTHAFARHQAEELWTALEGLPQGRIFLNELRGFLDEYGHREAGGTMLLSQETWRDAPQVVLGMLKGMAMRTARAHAGNQQFEDARQKASRGFLMHLPGARSLFGKVLQQARSFVQVREDTRFYATLVMPVLRRTLLEMGRRLEEQGVLDEAADVFHLRMEELEAAARAWPPDAAYSQSLAQLVRRRKEKRATLQETPLIDPRLYRRQAPRAQKTRRGALLQGTPGSPGVVVGPVCVVRDGAEFGKLRAGDVLVAPYTNPAWTPLFQTAAAVVVDTGSAASHAAITAREYGIPAVMATVDGTGQLWDGQMVKVDGGQGVVWRAT